MSDGQLLVYVQALPVSIPSNAKKFSDIETSEFKMTQSSKAALTLATSLGFHEIVAAGFSPILREALARGATGALSIPLCDDPVEQAKFFPKQSSSFSHIILGENSDWVFSGASLAGVLAQAHKLPLELFCAGGDIQKISQRSVILVKDYGGPLSLSSSSVDVRRINASFDLSINPESALGSSTLSKQEEKHTETISGDAADVSTVLSRRLRRIAGE